MKPTDHVTMSAHGSGSPRSSQEEDMRRQPQTANVVFEKPKNDWVPLAVAPYFYADAYLSTPHQWQTYLENLLRALADDVDFGLSISEDRVAAIKALGCQLELSPRSGELWLETCDHEDFPAVRVYGSADVFFPKLDSRTIPQGFAKPIAFHRDLAHRLLSHMHLRLARAIRGGAALLMCRPLSPLNPFAVIYPDQWVHFHVDKPALPQGAT
jgi:hypothetical protein